MKILFRAPKRKRITFALGVVAVAGLTMSPLMSGVTQAGIEKGKDLLAMLDARSPGGRPEGALLDTKLRKAAAAGTPHQYAMPKTRERFDGPAFAPDGPFLPAGTSAVPLDQISYVAPPAVYDPGPGMPFISGPGPVPAPPIISQPTPPGGPYVPQNPPPSGPPPVSAVPEPALWMQMIFGFGAIAMILRARRRKQNAAQLQLAASAVSQKG